MADVPEWSVKKGPFVFRGQFRVPVLTMEGETTTEKRWVVAFLNTGEDSKRKAPTMIGYFLDQTRFFEWPAGAQMVDEAGAREALTLALKEMCELILASSVIES